MGKHNTAIGVAVMMLLAFALIGCAQTDGGNADKVIVENMIANDVAAPENDSRIISDAIGQINSIEITDKSSDFMAKVTNCYLARDYEGRPAVVIECIWTNNSGNPNKFEVAITDSVTQNRMQLERAVVTSTEDRFDMEASYAVVESGATQTVYQAFLLVNESNITVELSDWYDTDKKVLAKCEFTLPKLAV